MLPDPFSWLTQAPPWATFITGACLGAGLLWAVHTWRNRRPSLDPRRCTAIIASLPDALITVDEQQRIVMFNPAAERLLVCPAGQALGQPLTRFLPPEIHADHARWMVEFGRAPDVSRAMRQGREIEAMRADGQRVAAEASVARLIDPYWPGGAQLYTVVLRDIASRKAAQAQLHRVQERYRRMVEQSPDAICLTEGNRIEMVNRICLQLLGADDERQVVGQHPQQLFGPAWPALLDAALVSAGAPLRRVAQLIRLDGTTVDVELSAASVPDHDHAALQLVMRDITERQRANQALKQQRDELRQLSTRLTHAREEERRHLSRELHDELGQHLTAIRLDMAALGRDCEPALRPQLTDLMKRVDTIVTSVRRIASDLRPAMLDDLGLEAALEWLIKDWAARGSTAMHYHLEPLDVSLNDAAKTAVYRIVQEALTNVTRHAQASEVQVSLRREGCQLHIVVEDDGVGLAPDATQKRHSHGLRGIRERARALGGRADMSDRTPRGCRLDVCIPFDRVDSNLGELQETP